LRHKAGGRLETISTKEEVVLIIPLVIHAAQILVVLGDRGMREEASSSCRHVRGEGGCIRIVLAFVGAKVPEFVLANGTAKGATVLLVGERRYGIGG